MSNHNYANFEITSLLPNINPYKKLYPVTGYFNWIECLETSEVYIMEDCEPHESTHNILPNDVWTFEDIRKYLFDNKIVLNIEPSIRNNSLYYRICIVNFEKNELYYIYNEEEDDCEYWSIYLLFDTYESARQYGLIHILTKLKNESV